MQVEITFHPETLSLEWEKYRYIMNGGDDFIEKYMIKFSAREDNSDFIERKAVSPIPAFTRGAIMDVKNAIFQRMSDIARSGGSESYNKAVSGKGIGVDLEGSTMNHFIGKKVLPELLFMGKVGVFVDMPPIPVNATLAETKNLKPYFYVYKRENIKNWSITYPEDGYEFDKLLLLDQIMETDPLLGLPKKVTSRYRYIFKEDGVIKIRFFDLNGVQIDKDGQKTSDDEVLNIEKIPFVLFELEQPLTKDIANHQIALLNLESSDIAYALKANFPFYTEQTTGLLGKSHIKTENPDSGDDGKTIEVGSVTGRTYGKDLDRPGFIHPSSEPLNASIEKQKALKEDIRMLVNLALSNVKSKFASAESKEMDERGLESGLSALGLILEQGERQLAKFFASYENSKEIATIRYPERYSLKTDSQRISEAGTLSELKYTVASKTYTKAIDKEVARILLGAKISTEDFDKIINEIDETNYSTADPETISLDIDKGLVSLDTASKARGYDPSEVEKAAKDHADRIKRIQEAQTDPSKVKPNSGARGVADLEVSDSAKEEKKESQDPDLDETGRKRVRGNE